MFVQLQSGSEWASKHTQGIWSNHSRILRECEPLIHYKCDESTASKYKCLQHLIASLAIDQNSSSTFKQVFQMSKIYQHKPTRSRCLKGKQIELTWTNSSPISPRPSPKTSEHSQLLAMFAPRIRVWVSRPRQNQGPQGADGSTAWCPFWPQSKLSTSGYD